MIFIFEIRGTRPVPRNPKSSQIKVNQAGIDLKNENTAQPFSIQYGTFNPILSGLIRVNPAKKSHESFKNPSLQDAKPSLPLSLILSLLVPWW
ncbi:MAG: hypothetical protein WCD79_12640 [Chthoniobacteraceae bacterium]